MRLLYVFLAGILCHLPFSLLGAEEPTWWIDENVISGSAADFSGVNFGQLKTISVGAKAHFDQALASSGGGGSIINNRINELFANSANQDYKAVRLGELKYIADAFYSRLQEVGYDIRRNLIANGYPANWQNARPWGANSSGDYSMVTLGQMKMAFSFEISDSNGDGKPDFEEGIYPAEDPERDTDGDGVVDLEDDFPFDPTKNRENAYASLLNDYLFGDGLVSPPEQPETHQDVVNGKVQNTLLPIANDIRLRTWAVCNSDSAATAVQRTELLSQIQQEMDFMMTMIGPSSPLGTPWPGANTGWFWPVFDPSSGTRIDWGEPNYNRFILAEIIDSLCLLMRSGHLSSKCTEWKAELAGAVTWQYQRYVHGEDEGSYYQGSLSGNYPNMDAAYALIMRCAGEIYSNANYTTRAQLYLGKIKNAILPGGAIPYLTDPTLGTSYWNDAIIYTELVINYLARYHSNFPSGSDLVAREALINFKDYFPIVLTGPGIPEVSSAPWFKHFLFGHGGYVFPGYPQVIANLTGDPETRYFANRLLNATNEDFSSDSAHPTANNALKAVATEAYWDQGGSIEPPRDSIAFLDADIKGVRGKFGKFAWVGSAGSVTDTVTGGFVFRSVSSLLQNSGLEQMVNGFFVGFDKVVYAGSPTISIDDDGGRSQAGGNIGKAFKVAFSNSSRGGIQTDACHPIPGKQYKVTVWYRAQNTTSKALVRLYMYYRNDPTGVANDRNFRQLPWTGVTYSISRAIDQDVSPNPFLQVKGNGTGTGWNSLEITFTTPLQATALEIECMNEGVSASGAVWFDDISVEEVNGETNALASNGTLLAISAEAGNTSAALDTSTSLTTQASYATPMSYTNSLMVGGNRDFALQSVQYKLHAQDLFLNGEKSQIERDWLVAQTWLYLPDRMIGRVRMQRTSAGINEGWARVRVLTLPSNTLIQYSPTTISTSGEFSTMGMSLSVLANTFGKLSKGPAENFDFGIANADQLSLDNGTDASSMPHSYSNGQAYDCAFDIRPADVSELGAANFTYGASGGLTYYNVTTADDTTYQVAFNGGSQTVPFPYTIVTPSASTPQTLSQLYITSPQPSVVEPVTVTSSDPHPSLSEGQMGCLITTRNLINNPGMERVQGSPPMPTGFSNVSYTSPAPTFALDSQISRSGYNSMSITCTPSSRGAIVPPRFNQTGGKKYKLTVWYRSTAPISPGAIMTRLIAWKVVNGQAETDKEPWQSWWLVEDSGVNTQVSTNSFHVTPTDPAHETWKSFSVTFQLPASAVQFSVECFNFFGNGTIWFDDLSVVEVEMED